MKSIYVFKMLNMQYHQLLHNNDCLYQGWVFAMAKTIFAGTVEKTGKNRGKNRQKLAKSKTP